MRRQNPPHSYLVRAQEIETYLRPVTIAAVYGTCGISYAAFISLLFLLLVYGSFLNPTPITVMIFAVFAFIPSTFAFLAWFLRPNDPLSSYLKNLAGLWRNPIAVPGEPCTFKARLGNGDAFCIDISFYYPLKDQNPRTRERLYTCIHAAIAQDSCMRNAIPTMPEIEAAIDRPLEMLATECDIPVLYAEIESITSER